MKGSLYIRTACSPSALHNRAREYLLIQRDECYNPTDEIAWPILQGIYEGKPPVRRCWEAGGMGDEIMRTPQEDEAKEDIRDLKRSLN